MDVKSLSAVLGHVSSDITLDIYAHITTDMQIEAARSIDRSIGKASELDSRSTVKVDDKPKDDFKPVLNTTRRHPGMGCISEINDHYMKAVGRQNGLMEREYLAMSMQQREKNVS